MRRRLAAALQVFLQSSLGIARNRPTRRHEVAEARLHHPARRLEAAVDMDCADDRFADVAEDALVRPRRRAADAVAEDDVGHAAPGDRHVRAGLLAHDLGEALRQLALVCVRPSLEQPRGDDDAEHAVSEEFQPLVVRPATFLGRAHVRQRLDEERAPCEDVADTGLQRFQRLALLVARHGLSGSGRRCGPSAPSTAIPRAARRRPARRSRRR